MNGFRLENTCLLEGKKTDAWFWDVECMILNFDVICVHTYI